MKNGLYMNAVVYDCDGILAASFVGDYDTLRAIFADSVDDKHCPAYYQKRIRSGSVHITDMQVIIDDAIETAYFGDTVPAYIVPFMCFIDAIAVDDSGTLSQDELEAAGSFLSEIDTVTDYLKECCHG